MKQITRRDFIRTTGGFVSAAILSPSLLLAEGAEKAKRFNILFLMTDQHHHRVMSCAGNPIVKTPTLDKLAADGVRFTHAVCAAPFCSPTRASLITGLWPHTHGIARNINDDKGLADDTRATEQLLFDQGYQTFQMGKWHLGDQAALRCYRKERDRLSTKTYNEFIRQAPKDAWHKPRNDDVVVDDVCLTPGMAKVHDVWKDEKKRSAQDLSITGRYLRPAEYNYESWLADRCVELIREYREKNFMITWSVSPPHALWMVPDPYYSMYDPEKMSLPPSWSDHPEAYQDTQPARLGKLMGENQVRETLRCYYGQVTMMDWCMGRILDALAEEGLEKDTLVVFTSDHGDMQGGHGMVDKSLPGYYDEILRVPLIMRYPSAIKPGRIVHTHANSVDIMPTLLDFAGAPIPKGVQGISLRALAEGSQSDDDRPGFCERGLAQPSASRMIRTRRWKYALFGKERAELFDLKADPYEMQNLAEAPAHKAVRSALHRQLLKHMEETNDPALVVLLQIDQMP
jgi:arylsulfatase A-like enzyme